MPPIRVLVFGSSGVGKTSLCNTVTKQNKDTGCSAVGCTFETQPFDPYRTENGQEIILVDTAGLNEAAGGTVSGQDAVKQLIKLLKHSKDGFNLLIFVMKKSPLLESHVQNYKLFVEVMTENKIPAICVVNGCEEHEPMDKWVNENKHHFMSRGLNFKQMLGTCFAKGGRFEDTYSKLRPESRTIVLSSIIKNAAPESIKIFNGPGGFLALLKKMWSFFADWFYSISKIDWRWLSQPLLDLLIRLGFTNDAARSIAREVESFT